MTSLHDVQSAFLAAVRGEDASMLASLVVADGIEPERRVQIYRNNHRLGALATLQATYPVVERLGGADWFGQNSARYLQRHPSRSGDLQWLGHDYPEFLRADLADSPYAYFADVAALEWAYQLVLTAADRPPVDLAVLQGIAAADYERLLFVPRPALQLVESSYPIFAIWHAHQPGADTPAEIRLDVGASRVLLIRRRDHVELRELAPGCCLLLQRFQRGESLGDAAAAFAPDAGTPAADAEAPDLQWCLRELLGLETIADITVGEHR